MIAADPKHLGARIGITSVLHTWGSAMTHHPHVHMIVPGGGLSEDGTRWIACRPNFFLAVRVLSRLFRRLVLQMLIVAHETGRLQFFGAADRSPAPTTLVRWMLRQCLAITAATPNLIPMPVVHAPLGRSTRQIAVHPLFLHLENRRSHSSNPHRSQRRNRAPSGPRFRALALLGRLS